MPNKREKRKKGKGNFPNPGPAAVIYKGPLKPSKMKQEAESIVTTLNFTGILPSTAGGVIDSSYSNDPNSYSLADWTSLVALYHEYRVLGVRVEYFPWNRYNKTTTVCTPLITVVDRAAAGTLGSYQAAMSHESAKKCSLEDPWSEEARMESIEEATYISTSSTTASFWIKFYADGLSVSTTYGRMFVYVVVQLRGRK